MFKMKVRTVVSITGLLILLSGVGMVSTNECKSNCLQNSNGDPDSVWVFGIPYFKIVQLFDSCFVSCIFGEVVIHRASGELCAVDLFSHSFTHDPRIFSSMDNIRDSTRTNEFTLMPGDTLWYYKSTSLSTLGASGRNLGVIDTLVFYTKLIESASGAVMYTVDTMGVLPVNCVDSVIYNVSLPMHSCSSNETLFYYVHSGSDALVAYLAMQAYSFGKSIDPTIGRFDMLSPSYYSALWAFEKAIITAEIDSILGLAKSGYGASKRERMLQGLQLDVHPNPANSNIRFDFTTSTPSKIELMLYNPSGVIAWRGSRIITLGGQLCSMDVNVSSLPSGSYVLIPIVDGRVFPGEIVNIMK